MEQLELNEPASVGLSEPELRVLKLISDGHRRKEAAEALYISKRTVDFHLANVYDKLKVGNRVQAVRVAERLGLIPGGPG